MVYGDIGTSPLYALREAFVARGGLALTLPDVLGVLSLIFWSLILVVSVKYLGFILRADNRGEGGILALMALLLPAPGPTGRRARAARGSVVLLGLFGAALLYGDGMITPAISVLSAVEGLEVLAPGLKAYVLPLTVGILAGLFLVQRRGTAGVGAVFGPIMVVWFLVIGGLGLHAVVQRPGVLVALNPAWAAHFVLANGLHAIVVLGAVFLVVTGAEALYADLGHFGARAMRIPWFALVLPALALNYFGQGALLLGHPEALRNPFYLLAPPWFQAPLVALATAATIIASQAIITGAFSLTMQAVHLGFWPRLSIAHTSAAQRGQIYMPEVNWALMAGTLLLVLVFRSSGALAGAYGVAITTTMVITTLLFYHVARERWGWGRPLALVVVGSFLAVDLAFFAGNLPKVPEGGWFPLAVAAAAFTLMTTWRRGRAILAERMRRSQVPLVLFLERIAKEQPLRVPGTAVFPTSNPAVTPPALQRILAHNKVLHAQVVVLTVRVLESAYASEEGRVSYEELGDGLHRIVAHYGFMEPPDVPDVLEQARRLGFDDDPDDTTYFLGRERLLASEAPGGMALWREKLFALMSRNAQQATQYFRIPPEKVIEVGAQIEL